ncbi:MAG: hypothetical protein ACNYNX_04320 [Leucobacter sp.]
MQEIGVLGAGGQALEFRGYSSAAIRFHAVEHAFLQEGAAHAPLVDIENPPPELREMPVIAAVGAPGARHRLVRLWPGRNFASATASGATLAEDVQLGRGSVIAPGGRVMSGTHVGEHVLINSNAVVSHEVWIGDFCTISPGATLGGRSRLADGVFIGIGATVVDGVNLGTGAVVGAGAVVLSDVMPYEVVVGVPARRLRMEEDWLRAI